MHAKLDHKHVVKFHRHFNDENYVYLLLDLCGNTTLRDVLKVRKRLTELEVKYYVRQITEGLVYLKEQNVIHRDLKLGNLFIDDNMQIKIGDFGLCAQLKTNLERRKSLLGTPNYIAPEVLDDAKYKGHSFEVDTWALGVIIYMLLYGRPPFECKETAKTYSKIRLNDFTIPSEPKVSEDAKSLIHTLLVGNPSCRLSLKQILSHPFLIGPEQIPP